MKDLAERETKRDEIHLRNKTMRQYPSWNQNETTRERETREGRRESPVNQRRKERSQAPKEKRENSVRERNYILMERLLKYYYFL